MNKNLPTVKQPMDKKSKSFLNSPLGEKETLGNSCLFQYVELLQQFYNRLTNKVIILADF